MIFMGIYRMPYDKTDEWMNCMNDYAKNPVTEGIKKWQTFTGSDEFGYIGYNLIFTEKGKSDEAMMAVSKTMLPFTQIEGASWTIEPVMSAKASLKLLGKT